MSKIKVYIVAKATKYDDIDIFGTPLGRLLHREFEGMCIETSSPDKAEEDGITAVLYPDTPLVNRAFLEELSESIESGLSLGYRLGEGYIRKANAPIDKESVASAWQIRGYADVRTLLETRRAQILERHFDNGVRLIDPASCYIDERVEIAAGATIYPMCYLRGKTKIAKNAVVYSYCDLTDTVVGEGTDIRATYAVSAKIGKKATVGPYACLRKGAIIGDNCRVGDFVEIKNSTLENDVKAAHLAYVGDSYVGENTNIGCGVIFANYDGKVKRSVIVGKDVFIGCNTNLIAPLEVEDNAYIAAGSTVTQNVPGNSLCIARARQVVKNDWIRPKK